MMETIKKYLMSSCQDQISAISNYLADIAKTHGFLIQRYEIAGEQITLATSRKFFEEYKKAGGKLKFND